MTGTVLSGVGLVIEEAEKDQDVSLKIEEEHAEGGSGSEEVLRGVVEGENKKEVEKEMEVTEKAEETEENKIDVSHEIKSEVVNTPPELEVAASAEVKVEDQVEVTIDPRLQLQVEAGKVPDSESKEDSNASTDPIDVVSS